MEKSRTKLLAVNTYAGILLRFVNLFVQFIIRTILISTLGNQYTGVSGLFTSILSVLSLAELGIGSAITFALYKPIANKDYLQVAKLMNFYKFAYRIIAIVIFAIGLCLIPMLSIIVTDIPDIKESITILYFIYLIQSVSSYLLIYKSVLLTVNQKGYVISFIDIACNIIKTIIEVFVLVVFHHFLVYLIIEVLFSIIRNVIISCLVSHGYKELLKYKHEKLKKDDYQSLMKNIGALSLYSIANVVLTSTDNIVISSIIGTSIITLVSNYKMIINGIDGFIWYFYGALNPSAGNYAVTHTHDEQYQLFRTSEFAAFCFTCMSSVCLISALDIFIGQIWLDDSFVLPLQISIVLVIDYYLNNMLRPVSVFRNANGLFLQGKYRPLLMAILNIFLSIVLGIYYGVFGVLFATVISRLLTQFWFDPWVIYKHVFCRKLNDYFKNYLKYFLVFVVDLIAIFYINNLIVLDNVLIQLILSLIIDVIISLFIIILIFYRTREFKYIVSKLSKSH